MTERRRRTTHSTAPPRTVPIELSATDLEMLVSLASYHGRYMGAVRRLIQISSTGEMRDKARFVREESYWLRRFAEATRDELTSSEGDTIPARFTPRSLVAFCGRILASLNSPRSRRRLSAEEVGRRTTLAEKMASAIALLQDRFPELVETELDTRRPAERAWILETLHPPDGVSAPR